MFFEENDFNDGITLFCLEHNLFVVKIVFGERHESREKYEIGEKQEIGEKHEVSRES